MVSHNHFMQPVSTVRDKKRNEGWILTLLDLVNQTQFQQVDSSFFLLESAASK